MATKTRLQLKTEIDNLLADNTNQAISAEDIRTILGLMVDADFNLIDDEASDVSGIQSIISNNSDVDNNTNARHTHSTTGTVADNTRTIHSKNDDTTGTVNTRLVVTSEASANDNFATLLDALSLHDTELTQLSDKLNDTLTALRSFGILTP